MKRRQRPAEFAGWGKSRTRCSGLPLASRPAAEVVVAAAAAAGEQELVMTPYKGVRCLSRLAVEVDGSSESSGKC